MTEEPAPARRRQAAAPVLEVKGLSKSYGDRVALRDVSFAAGKGELLAVIGPNGAGKTTLLSILAGIIRPDAGEATSSNGKVGWVPQQAGLYRLLTAEENLRLFARMEGVDDVEGVVERMLEQTGLEERRGDQISSLSGGNQQRINIAIGLVGEPAVLLLDEPSSGLDPVSGCASGSSSPAWPRRGRRSSTRPTRSRRPAITGTASWSSPTGRRSSTAASRSFGVPRGPGPAGPRLTPENDFVRFLGLKGH